MNNRPWLKNCNHPYTKKYVEYYNKLYNEDLMDKKSSFKNKLKKMIVKYTPKCILIYVCGIIHAYIKPFLQSFKYRRVK